MKRTNVILSMLLICAFCLAACQPTPKTPPVVSKNDGTLENAIANGADANYIYEPPTEYINSETSNDGKVTIAFDENTNIKAPTGIKYPVYETTIDTFSAETLTRIAKACFGDAKMIEHTEQLSKSQILNDLILPRQQQIAEIENGSLDPTIDENGEKIILDDGTPMTVESVLDSLNLSLEHYQDMMKDAPDTVEEVVISTADYKPGTNFNADIIMPDGTMGRLCIYDNTLTVSLNYEAFVDTVIDIQLGGVNGEMFMDFITSESALGDKYLIAPGLSYDKAASDAKAFLSKLGGFDDYEFYGMGLDWISNAGAYNDDGTISIAKYGVTFMRKVSGSVFVPDDQVLAYGQSLGQSSDLNNNPEYSEPFRYEKLVVWVGANGIDSMYWSAPLKFERELQSSAKLIDFEKVAKSSSDSARRYFVGSDNGYSSDEVESSSIKFTEFELGYAIIKEKNKEGFFLMIPVWVASYNVTRTLTATGEPQFIDMPRAIVINALDGSVIDRMLGY